MQHEKKYWEGFLNADDADAFVQFTEYINMKDFRFGTTSDKGFAKQLESVGSNVEIPNPLLPEHLGPLPVLNTVIGVAYDWPRRRVIYFTYSSQLDNGIWCFDFKANKIYKVLTGYQVSSGSGFLGGLFFQQNNLIHSARVENGCVYWTDNAQQPRRVNIDAGIKMNDPSYVTSVSPYTLPLSQSVITVIRRQPGLPPSQNRVFQTTPLVAGNQINGEAFLFAYRYVYREFEVSALSGQSLLAGLSDITQYNRIDVTIPLGESIDQDVIQVDLVAIYLVSGVAFIINSWKKSIPAQAAQIAAHNAGTTALSYKFYNDRVGIALDAAYTTKIFDSVPTQAQTMEMAKNRLFFGNYVTGYDTPTATSLALTTTQQTFSTSGSVPYGDWYLLKLIAILGGPIISAYILITSTNFPSHHDGPVQIYTYSGTVPPFPASVNFSDLTFRGNSVTEAAGNIGSTTFSQPISNINQNASSLIIGGTPSVTTLIGTAFKSNASYQLSISFKDNYGRECGVLTTDTLLFYTPDTGLNLNTYVTLLSWTLSNVNANGEIPFFAYYYSINLTKCLKMRFFLQSLGVLIYAKKDADGNYTFTTTTYADDVVGIAIDLTILNSHSQGYVYTAGDVVELYVHGTLFVLSVLGQSAQYIICQPKDVGTLVATSGIFELYTPYQRQANEPYFEQQQIYPVFNPGAMNRMYSALTGTIGGDISLLQRQNSGVNYITEAMSPIDAFYKYWFTNAGRPNFLEDIGQQHKTSTIAYSNTFIAGTRNNGLSTFDALDVNDISPDFGPIQKLQLSSRVQKVGTVMLAICSGPATASIYLGENTLISQTGDTVIAQANTVIGSVHELKGNWGTLNPESVVEFRGNIYWFDVQNGCVVQYAENGLFPISNYKMSRYWKLFSDQYKSLSAAEIQALGGRPFVFGCADPHHGELLFTVPRTLSGPPKGYLLDHPDIPYPFDIWDGQGKTLVFKLYTQPNRWQGSYSFVPEFMCYMEDNLYSFKNGKMFLHNESDSYCNYYGVQYMPAVMDLCNQQLNKPRVPDNFSAESNSCPSLIYLMAVYPYVQATDLVAANFSNKEGIFYAAVLRNKFDPAFLGNQAQALLEGEHLRATAIYIMSQWDASAGIVQVKFINNSYTVSLGQPV